MKLILSERELEIIKQQEYKRGWYECGVANEIHINNLKNYMTPPFEGKIEGFNKPSLATAEFRNEHGFAQESCQHESNGVFYTSYPPKNGCKKCGEFY